MLTIPVIRILDDTSVEGTQTFDAPTIPPIASGRTYEAAFRMAIDSVPRAVRLTLIDLYRELVLANFAEFDTKKGGAAEPALSSEYPNNGTLPGFVRKSGRYNATGLILYNAEHGAGVGGGYGQLPSILAAMIDGGWQTPQVPLEYGGADGSIPAEEVPHGDYWEGSTYSILVNAYERSAEARAACLRHFGYDCQCCGFNFEAAYGEAGREFIHVHHHVRLAAIRSAYRVDPIRDLIPVCANCHAIIHRPNSEPYTVDEVRALLRVAA